MLASACPGTVCMCTHMHAHTQTQTHTHTHTNTHTSLRLPQPAWMNLSPTHTAPLSTLRSAWKVKSWAGRCCCAPSAACRPWPRNTRRSWSHFSRKAACHKAGRVHSFAFLWCALWCRPSASSHVFCRSAPLLCVTKSQQTAWLGHPVTVCVHPSSPQCSACKTDTVSTLSASHPFNFQPLPCYPCCPSSCRLGLLCREDPW